MRWLAALSAGAAAAAAAYKLATALRRAVLAALTGPWLASPGSLSGCAPAASVGTAASAAAGAGAPSAAAKSPSAAACVGTPPTAAGGAAASCPGLLAALTPTQRAELAAARETFEAAGGVLDAHADAFLLRFLRNHAFSATKAAPQLRATAAWRNESGAARVRAEYASGATLCSHEPYVRLLRMIGALVGHRTTADGDVLVIWHVGSFDSSAWLAGMTSAEWREVTLRVLEYGAWRADALSTATGSLVRVSFIIDYDGLALKHHDPRIVARILPVLRWPDAHYPEYLGVALLVNAPWMFARLWDLLSPALSYALQERINILRAADSPAAVAALAAAADLPRAYGGELDVMPADVRAAMGIDRLGAGELARLFPGSGALGGYARLRAS